MGSKRWGPCPAPGGLPVTACSLNELMKEWAGREGAHPAGAPDCGGFVDDAAEAHTSYP